MQQMAQDQWLQRWLPLLRAAPGSRKPVLELGCDNGADTAWLLERGFAVVATDLSLQALLDGKGVDDAANALQVQHDLRKPFPFREESFGVVVASLCLHYFDWRTTVAAVAEVRRCLAPGGLLLCRLNSVRDVLHGAGQGEEVEPHFYRQSARYATHKRFFDADDLDRLFPHEAWEKVSREECTILRYAAPKIAWELVLRAAQ
jgi:SAM-dependent methyltransferase